MNPHENRIRDLAYQIWESEGRPHGQDARHWDIACQLAAESDETAGADQFTSTVPKGRKASITSQGAAVSQQQAEVKPAKPARKSRAKSTTPQMN